MILAPLLLPLVAPQILGAAPPVIGPIIGDVGHDEASVFVRLDRQDPLAMALVDASGKVIKTMDVRPNFDQGYTAHWRLTGLEADSTYAVTIAGERVFFKTATDPGRPARLSLAIGSCADDRPGLKNPVWRAIQKDEPDALVLIGDSPYIDGTDLNLQRRRYVEFFGSPELMSLLKRTTLHAVWDDHDFAGEGSDGRAPGKEHARQAFVEHHPVGTAGESNQGVYSSFRRGPVEAFLLDTRWFSGTAKSYADPGKPTLLGEQQWEWLQRGLAASTAPFKLLVSGMAWNGAVRPGKPDRWMAYPHERAALFEFLAEKSIAGVVLVSGDVHRTRVFQHPPEETGVAYPLTELMTSPLGTNPEKEAGVASPNLVFDQAEAHAYLLATADSREDPPVLAASFRSAGAGEFGKIVLRADELRPHPAILPAARQIDGDLKRTEEVLARAKANPGAQIVFLGDSITQGWEEAGKEVWDRVFAPHLALNLGVSGDRTQHVLWRIDHGQLDGLRPKLVVLMIGTNNSNAEDNSSAEIAQGIAAVVGRVRRKLPEAKVLLLAVFPRGEKPNPQRTKNDEASHMAAEAVADGKSVHFLDLSSNFLGPDGLLPREVMPDALHPSTKGYEIWAKAIEAKVKELTGG